MSRASRFVLTFACALSTWLWSGLAAAQSFEAPRCDVRGATTFAEPPVLQPLWRSLDVAAPNEGCHHESDDDVLSQGHERVPSVERVAAEAVTLGAFELRVDPAAPSGSMSSFAHGLTAALAHARGLERPPR